ncbi:MAG: histidine kinase dimerization/phosphoacceptor domain -containing protein [Gracilimonas sp.]
MNNSEYDVWNSDFNLNNFDAEETNLHLKPILKLATDICGVPFSVVILTDKNEQKTLAKYGECGDQDFSSIQNICGNLLSENDIQVINNLREDQEYKSTLSTGDLETVSFYAGAQLKSESGQRIGSLCLFDSKPKDLTESQKESLQTLADETVLRLKNYQLKKFLQESQKKVAESGVYELKEKFQKVVDVVTDLIYELDWNTRKLIWGDELSSVLGYPNEERFADYDWWLDKIHPDDLEKVIHDVSKTVEGESNKAKLVYRIKTHAGSYKHVMNYQYVDRKEDGSPDTIIGAIVDISDLREVEDQSERHQKLLEELADQTYTAIWIRDRDGKHLFMNQNYRDLFELSEQRVIGKTVHDLFNEHKARQFYENDQIVLESGESHLFEESVKTKMGKRFYKTNIFPISGGKVAGISIDITDEIVSQEKLENLVQEKETLLMEIHHRVKNNLAIVSGMLQLQSFKEEDQRVQNKLLDSVSRIKTIANIHELLYQSSSFTHLKLKENISKLIVGITSYYEASADLDVNFNLESIILNINQAIPLSLIINEVVTNILKHAFDEGESGTLSLSLFEDEGSIKLIIEDNGKGLPDDFDPKGREETLGLELINTLASQLDADYTYKSLEKGAQFTISFQREEKKGAGSSFL